MKKIISILTLITILTGLVFSFGACGNEQGGGASFCTEARSVFVRVDLKDTEYDINDVSVTISLGHKYDVYYYESVKNKIEYYDGEHFVCAGTREQFSEYGLMTFKFFESKAEEFENLKFLDKIEDFATDKFYCKTDTNEHFYKGYTDFNSQDEYWDAYLKWSRLFYGPLFESSYKFPFSNVYTLSPELFTQSEGSIIICFGMRTFMLPLKGEEEKEEKDYVISCDPKCAKEIFYRLSEDGTKATLYSKDISIV